MKVDREGVGETHTVPIGEMSKSTNLAEPKTTKHDKTRYSSEEGKKIPSDLEVPRGMLGRKKSGSRRDENDAS